MNISMGNMAIGMPVLDDSTSRTIQYHTEKLLKCLTKFYLLLTHPMQGRLTISIESHVHSIEEALRGKLTAPDQFYMLTYGTYYKTLYDPTWMAKVIKELYNETGITIYMPAEKVGAHMDKCCVSYFTSLGQEFYETNRISQKPIREPLALLLW